MLERMHPGTGQRFEIRLWWGSAPKLKKLRIAFHCGGSMPGLTAGRTAVAKCKHARTNAVCKQLPFAALLRKTLRIRLSSLGHKGTSNHAKRKKVAEATFAARYA